MGRESALIVYYCFFVVRRIGESISPDLFRSDLSVYIYCHRSETTGFIRLISFTCVGYIQFQVLMKGICSTRLVFFRTRNVSSAPLDNCIDFVLCSECLEE